MANATGLQFTLTLPGANDVTVVDFTLTEALSRPFHLAVNLVSRDPELDPADHLDRDATLTIWQDGEVLRRVHGIVTTFGRGDRGHRRTFYSLTLQPALWRLSLRHNSRIFQNVSPLTIINTLCDERGITDVAFAATREPAEREYCVQYRETDLAFIQRLAAEEGLFYFHEFFETGEDSPGGVHRLVFADAPQVLASLGSRTYHGRAGGTPPLRHVRKLKQVSRVRPASATLKDYSFKRPAYSQLHQAQLHEQVADGLEAEHYDYPGRYKADASGEAFTRIRLEHLRHDALTAEAESDLPELAPGNRFTLTDHDAERLNRDWQVVSVVHHGRQPQALQEDAVGVTASDRQGIGGNDSTRYHNELLLTPADTAWRPEPDPKPRVDGPQVAFVVGPEGEEIHCDEHGRVKVQFPWDRYAAPDETASAWLRVSQGWAGGGYGSIAIPRIGHEVIVSFLEGDPDQPLITGRTYHAVNTPPYALPEHKTRTVLRTQSHKGDGFNELRFEDEAEREQIWLHAQKDLELLTNHDRTEEIGNDSFLTVNHNRISEIHHDDHLTVRGQRHVQVHGDDHLIVGANRHEKIGRARLMEAGQEIHYKAGSKAVIESGAEITLKAGGSFIKLDPSGITIVGAQVKINSGGSPGSGREQAATAALLPGQAAVETSNDVTLTASGQPTDAGDFMAATFATVAATSIMPEPDAMDDDAMEAQVEEPAIDPEEETRQKAARWRCRQEQISAARQKTEAMPANDERAHLLATTERFERNNMAVEHARLSQHVYHPDRPAPTGWTDISQDEELIQRAGIKSAELLTPDESNFGAGIYISEPKIFGGNFTPTLSFKGTNFSDLEDIQNNLAQGLNTHSDFYERAVNIGRRIKDSGADIHFTGHSLGGGLASAASRTSGLPATTFNASGLHPKTVERYGGTLHRPATENIQAFRINGELLTSLQEHDWGSTLAGAGIGSLLGGWKGAAFGALGSNALAMLMPDAVGAPYRLPGRGTNPIERHSMVQVIEGLEAQKAMDQRIIADATDRHCR
ncbi:type VI secretion system tip protein VgrG [Billgrantia montanilacus]|uniref:Type VI secretion system tip protein VgrG n=1 Tax=Billgrantia montanilacus TaxID=2282305 RepID=A0A368U4P2_9GAMM|nr:type VI secretion system tip protein VgrG [Halomonas montanilacus]